MLLSYMAQPCLYEKAVRTTPDCRSVFLGSCIHEKLAIWELKIDIIVIFNYQEILGRYHGVLVFRAVVEYVLVNIVANTNILFLAIRNIFGTNYMYFCVGIT